MASQPMIPAVAMFYREPVYKEREQTAANQKPKQEGAPAQLPEASGSSSEPGDVPYSFTGWISPIFVT